MHTEYLLEWIREHRAKEAAAAKTNEAEAESEAEAEAEAEGDTLGSEERESKAEEGTSDRGKEWDPTKW